jgi:O-antigen/teichoic acid export membrane protein
MIGRVVEKMRGVLPKKAFARNVSVLAGGTLGAQIITVAFAPLLTRLYLPSDFGLLAVFSGILGILTVAAAFRYEMAIPLPASDTDACHIARLSLLLLLGNVLLVAVLVWVKGSSIVETLKVPQLGQYLWLMPIGMLCVGAYQIFNVWATRYKRFKVIAGTRMRQSFAMTGFQVLGYSMGPAALLGGQVIGQAAGTVSLAASAYKDGAYIRTHWRDVLAVANRYRKFPIYDLWYGLFNTASIQIAPILFAAFFGSAAAGFFALAQRVLAMPLTLIGTAVSKVFFAHAAEARRDGGLGLLVEKVQETMSRIAMPPCIMLFIAGPDLFALIFGERWRSAGEFARWLSPWLYAVFITSPISTIFAVLERQFEGAIFQGLLLIVRVGALVIGAHCGGVIMAIVLFSTISAVMFAFLLAWIYRICGIPAVSILRSTVMDILIGIATSIPILISYGMGVSGLPRAASIALTVMLIASRYLTIYKKET